MHAGKKSLSVAVDATSEFPLEKALAEQPEDSTVVSTASNEEAIAILKDDGRVVNSGKVGLHQKLETEGSPTEGAASLDAGANATLVSIFPKQMKSTGRLAKHVHDKPFHQKLDVAVDATSEFPRMVEQTLAEQPDDSTVVSTASNEEVIVVFKDDGRVVNSAKVGFHQKWETGGSPTEGKAGLDAGANGALVSISPQQMKSTGRLAKHVHDKPFHQKLETEGTLTEGAAGHKHSHGATAIGIPTSFIHLNTFNVPPALPSSELQFIPRHENVSLSLANVTKQAGDNFSSTHTHGSHSLQNHTQSKQGILTLDLSELELCHGFKINDDCWSHFWLIIPPSILACVGCFACYIQYRRAEQDDDESYHFGAGQQPQWSLTQQPPPPLQQWLIAQSHVK